MIVQTNIKQIAPAKLLPRSRIVVLLLVARLDAGLFDRGVDHTGRGDGKIGASLGSRWSNDDARIAVASFGSHSSCDKQSLCRSARKK
jgi:hypothetical protein